MTRHHHHHKHHPVSGAAVAVTVAHAAFRPDPRTGRRAADELAGGVAAIGGAIFAAMEAQAQLHKIADAGGALLTDIDTYITKRQRQAECFWLPGLFSRTRTFFGGFYKQAKLDAAEYLKNMLMHFMLHDTGQTLSSALLGKTPAFAIADHLGPLRDGELGELFRRYLDCSSQYGNIYDENGHYARYQAATAAGSTFRELATKAAIASAAPTTAPERAESPVSVL